MEVQYESSGSPLLVIMKRGKKRTVSYPFLVPAMRSYLTFGTFTPLKRPITGSLPTKGLA